MIKIENVEICGWEPTIRGMRNPKNSWKRSDSGCENCYDSERDCNACDYHIGPNDHDLMMRLAKGGPVHAKYRRMITVYLDITAPLYWWKEFDTYKVGTVANSCSTMHKIAAKEFTLEDFSTEHLMGFDNSNYWEEDDDNACFIDKKEVIPPLSLVENYIIPLLNTAREKYLETKTRPMKNEKARKELMKKYWWQMIQLLPSSYNQKRTIMLNYEVLNNMYHSRKDHKLDEWREFCAWIESLPYSEIITGGKEEGFEIFIDPGKIPMEEFKKLVEIVNKFHGKFRIDQEKVEHLVDISRPGSNHPHYVIGLGASESDLTDYEKDLLKKSDEYWKDKE